MSSTPVILGGNPKSGTPVHFVRPLLPELNDLQSSYQKIFQTGMVTTGHNAEDFAAKVSEILETRHAIATSSCTTGLLLGIEALQLPPEGEVILPSFTFMASALAPLWNRLHPVFVDVDPFTMNIDPQRVREAITDRTVAILAVHQFGNPAPVNELETIASEYGLALFFDAAHGLGSLHHGKPLGGEGRFSAFSLTPTKLVIAGEGGMVTTNDPAIEERVRYGRNYANPGNYDCLFMGLNARMSELHAILGMKSLEMLEEAATTRNRIVNAYRERLGGLPGISFQHVAPHDRCSYKDFCIVIDEEAFGITRDQLIQALNAESVFTRVYYQPVLHRMTAFRAYAPDHPEETLPNTLHLEARSLCIPLYSDMREDEASLVCDVIESIHQHAPAIARKCA